MIRGIERHRYKSIFCQEDAYLKHLVAYIHLTVTDRDIVD